MSQNNSQDKNSCRHLATSRQQPQPRPRKMATVAQILHGWEGILDHHGNPLAFSDSNRDGLAALPFFAVAVVTAYSRWAAGLPEKNSLTLPASS